MLNTTDGLSHAISDVFIIKNAMGTCILSVTSVTFFALVMNKLDKLKMFVVSQLVKSKAGL